MCPKRLVRIRKWVLLLILMLLVPVDILALVLLPIRGQSETRQGTMRENLGEKHSSVLYASAYRLQLSDALFKENGMAISPRIDGAGTSSVSKGVGTAKATKAVPVSNPSTMNRTNNGYADFSSIQLPQSLSPAPAPAPSGGGTSYSGGALSATPQGYIAEAAPPPIMDITQFGQSGYAGQGSTYAAEEGAAKAAYDNLIAELGRQNTEYGTNFKGNLKSLGLDWQGDDYVNGSWNKQDNLGAFGQSYGNLQNDYAGRGMLDSTMFGTANEDLTRRFDRQRAELIAGLETQTGNYTSAVTAADASKKSAQNRALAEAYARYTQGLG